MNNSIVIIKTYKLQIINQFKKSLTTINNKENVY